MQHLLVTAIKIVIKIQKDYDIDGKLIKLNGCPAMLFKFYSPIKNNFFA